MAAGLGATGQGQNADELPHDSRRYRERRRELAGFGGGGRSKLGDQPPTQRHSEVQREDEGAFLGRRARRAVAVQGGVYLNFAGVSLSTHENPRAPQVQRAPWATSSTPTRATDGRSYLTSEVSRDRIRTVRR